MIFFCLSLFFFYFAQFFTYFHFIFVNLSQYRFDAVLFCSTNLINLLIYYRSFRK